ncbi:MAG: hypothetical protein IJW46_02995 [Clostridia bacterium]|nr:hypothetical protein [Clostridia bacterium]
MKNRFRDALYTLLAILILPLLFICLLFAVLMTPIDLIRYRRSPYFKAFRKRYTFMVCYNDTYRIYNEIVKREIPDIVYLPKDTPEPEGYLILSDLLIVHNLTLTFDPETEAFAPTDYEEDTPPTLEELADRYLTAARNDLPDRTLTRCVFLFDTESADTKAVALACSNPMLQGYCGERERYLALFELVEAENNRQ